MGLSVLSKIFRKESAPKAPASSKELADKLYEQASEQEKEEIRQMLLDPIHKNDANRTQERRRLVIPVSSKAHLEALVRRELLMRHNEEQELRKEQLASRSSHIREGIKTLGGQTLNFIKDVDYGVDKQRLARRKHLESVAAYIAQYLIKGLNRDQKQEILAVLQSLDQDQKRQELSEQTDAFFNHLKNTVTEFNKNHRPQIPLKIVQGQLFQILQTEHQPNANGKQRLIKKAEPSEVDELSPAEAAMLLNRIMKDAA